MKRLIGIALLSSFIGLTLGGTIVWLKHYFPSCSDKKGTQILSQYSFRSPQYDATAKQLLKESRIWKNTYFFMGFEQRYEKSYMLVKCEGEYFCGTVPVLLRHEAGLEKIRKTNGVSWHHTNLHKLRWRVEEIDGVEEIVFDGLHCIID